MEDEKLLEKMKRIFGDNSEEDVTEGIISMVDEGQEQGVFAGSEAEMIHNIFEFGEKDAKDIMTHRKNIIAIDGNEPLEAALYFILEQHYSRFPIYEEDIDNIIGTIHLRDVMKCYLDKEKRNAPIKELTEYIREVSYVPETKSIDSLFRAMQSSKKHMVIVLDEYGQTSGLVAMEDILEEIVGNILDEYDKEEETIVKMGKDLYLMPGLTELDDVEDTLGIQFEEEDFDTLNGFLIDRLERIPGENEKCFIHYGGYRFSTLIVKDNIIQKVRVEKMPQE
ncbi:MAG: hemolysin family protein [Hespellia sp.]|nr:hemolysin family protein [Hespellia sp.]